MEAIDALDMARVWDISLHVIPDADLPECFTRALEHNVDGQLFGANNIRAEFTRLTTERREHREKVAQSKSRRTQDAGVTFGEWFETDREWIRENLPAETQEMMREMFDKRKAKQNAR